MECGETESGAMVWKYSIIVSSPSEGLLEGCGPVTKVRVRSHSHRSKNVPVRTYDGWHLDSHLHLFVSWRKDSGCDCRRPRSVRESLWALLSSHRNFEIVAASNGLEALELVEKEHPDVLVLDLFMPGTDGFEVLRQLDRAQSQRSASVVLTGWKAGPIRTGRLASAPGWC